MGLSRYVGLHFLAHDRSTIDAIVLSVAGECQEIGASLPFKNFLLAYFRKKASCTTGPER